MSKKPADLLAAAFGMSASAARDFLDRVQEQLTRDVSNQFIVDLVIRMRSKAEAPIVRNTAQAVVAARPPGGEVRLRLTTPTRPREPAKVVPLVGPDPDNPESVRAFRCLESPTDAIFVTGRAGTGKSHLLKYWAGKTKKRIVVLSPTGLAAINVGGQTIHSFFRFPPRLLNKSDVGLVSDAGRRQLYRSVDSIVIDEVSMVNANLIDTIDQFMRLNGRDRRQPFGGAQLVMFGDPYQLPPIVATEEESKFFATHYRSKHFFDAQVFADLRFESISLRKNYRQTNSDFMALLGGIREGSLSAEQQGRLNARCRPGFRPPPGEAWLTLTTTNRRAERLNGERLEKLRGADSVFEAGLVLILVTRPPERPCGAVAG